mgnify:CR=1 FL=1
MPRPPEWFKKLSMPLADKIVYASGAYVALKSTMNDLSQTLVTFEGEPSNPVDERLLAFARAIRPMTSTGLELTRIGGATDGGYVMAEPIAASGAISIGVGSDVSWDQDIGSRGIPVAMFDHTVRKAPAHVPGGTFHRIGIGPTHGPKIRPLDQLVSIAGFAGRDDLLLKMDVEGAEWEALTRPAPANLQPFTRIVVELHGIAGLKDTRSAERILAAIEQLGETHYPVHVHANNYDELVRFGNWWFPNAIEVSFIRKDLLTNPKPATALRIDLDAPCDPRVTEIDLAALTRL